MSVESIERKRRRREERRLSESACQSKGCTGIAPPGLNLCPPCGSKQVLGQYSAWRQRFFDLYGCTCACCGSTADLTLDHVNGDGSEHRGKYGTSGGNYRIFRDAVRANDPTRFQALCLQCNLSKGNRATCQRHPSGGRK